jgi:DedD protein
LSIAYILSDPTMENIMRDLDQLEEQDPEERGRRTATLVMAGVVTVAVVSAVFAMIVQATSTHSAPEADPLDQLDRVVAKNSAGKADTRVQPATAEVPVEPKVDATKLSFEHALTENEERPEVLAALEAAAREEETLGTADLSKTGERRLPVVENVPPLPAAALEASDDVDDEPQLVREEHIQNAMPAGVAASSASNKLAKVARHDRLVAASLPKLTGLPLARMGSDGEFTLQVISYDTQSAAQQFSTELRAKGYEAFVAVGDVDGRGRVYRVRLGPYKTKQQADAARQLFETQERMNTIVVKRPRD